MHKVLPPTSENVATIKTVIDNSVMENTHSGMNDKYPSQDPDRFDSEEGKPREFKCFVDGGRLHSIVLVLGHLLRNQFNKCNVRNVIIDELPFHP